MVKVKLPNPCPVKNISPKIPEPLYNYITRHISRINEILANPQKYESNLKNKKVPVPNIGIFEYNEADELNKFSDVVKVLTSPVMLDLWKNFYEWNQHSLPSLFIFIQNHYSRAISNKQSVTLSKEQKDFYEHLAAYHRLKENPSELLETADRLVLLMEEFNGLIRPDGADCFEDMDVTAPENKMFLINGEIPFHIDWNLYITDDEYDIFIDILRKIVDKLNNRKLKYQTEYAKSVKFLEHPKTRKKEITNAPQIFMIRVLYLRFIELFKKPHYKEISIIISELFNSDYNENEIIKITKPMRDKIKFISQEIKKNGYTKYYDSLRIENMIYELI